MSSTRYLTKSRFKLAMECPTKLFYTSKDDEYKNNKGDNEFLASLAEGGFQVGKMATLLFPDGKEIKAKLNFRRNIDVTIRRYLDARLMVLDDINVKVFHKQVLP